MPEEIIDAVVRRNLVIFAGAGVSTEGQRVFKTSLYEDMALELGVSPAEKLPFSQLMDRACQRPDGRRQLLLKIKERFDYLRSFPEVYRQASRFHRSLAPIPFLDEIFTTNWDDLFERVCGATPIVTSDDFAFWDLPGRKVFKIHGSATSWGSLVLTSDEYENSYRRLNDGLIGSRLKLALATKTVLFVGYSMVDPDFVRLLDSVISDMGVVRPRLFVVTLDDSQHDVADEFGLTRIRTDATFFVDTLKRRLVENDVMFPESHLGHVLRLLDLIDIVHRRLFRHFRPARNPEVLHAASYQDGLRHACEHLLSMVRTGRYSHICDIFAAIDAYDDIRRDKLRSRIYEDVAYIDGYRNGLGFFVAPEEAYRRIPLYYVFGAGTDIRTLKEYRTAARHAAQLHRAAYRRAQSLARSTCGEDDLDFHHIAFL